MLKALRKIIALFLFTNMAYKAVLKHQQQNRFYPYSKYLRQIQFHANSGNGYYQGETGDVCSAIGNFLSPVNFENQYQERLGNV
jgi:hypothetical protein